MTEFDDLPFDYPSAATPSGALPRPCRHPKDRRTRSGDGGWSCDCGHMVNGDRVRRGRNAKKRGLDIQRAVNRAAGLDNIPYNAENHDGSSSMFASEVKSGGAFPERLWRWLKGVPTGADQTAILIVTDAPGPGKRRRAVVMLDLDDWIDLHGKDGTP